MRALDSTLASLVGILGLSACATNGAFLAPDPTPKGRTELGFAASAVASKRGESTLVVPSGEVYFRHGIGDSLDFGMRFSAVGFESTLRKGLWRSGGSRLALVPGLSFEWTPVTNDDTALVRGGVLLGLLFGQKLSEAFDLVVGFKPKLELRSGTIIFAGDLDTTEIFLLPGLSLGLAWEVLDGVTLFPELSAHLPHGFGESKWDRPSLQGGMAAWISFE